MTMKTSRRGIGIVAALAATLAAGSCVTHYPPPYVILPSTMIVRTVEEAMVRVVQHTTDAPLGPTIDSSGVVVGDNTVLTVLAWGVPIRSIEVEVPGRGTFPAAMVKVDALTGAALLQVGTSGLPAVRLDNTAAVRAGEPVVLLAGRQVDVSSQQLYAAPATDADAKNLFFGLFAYGEAWRSGMVVTNREGALLGVVKGVPQTREIPDPPPAVSVITPARLLEFMLPLSEGGGPSIPLAVMFSGPNRFFVPVDTPSGRASAR